MIHPTAGKYVYSLEIKRRELYHFYGNIRYVIDLNDFYVGRSKTRITGSSALILSK